MLGTHTRSYLSGIERVSIRLNNIIFMNSCLKIPYFRLADSFFSSLAYRSPKTSAVAVE